MKIRPAELADAEGIAFVKVKTWQTTYKGIYPEDKLKEMVIGDHTERWEKIILSNKENDNIEVFVAENMEGEVVGFASGGKYETTTPYDCEISAIYVLEKLQGKKIDLLHY